MALQMQPRGPEHVKALTTCVLMLLMMFKLCCRAAGSRFPLRVYPYQLGQVWTRMQAVSAPFSPLASTWALTAYCCCPGTCFSAFFNNPGTSQGQDHHEQHVALLCKALGLTTGSGSSS
ncbi:hypothetical protein BDV93DRAFT_564087 [Ceratobasidium sp. AG-I]|nr:hypothetical protein BDV93DRAFT_564087 [Ceratobasidium sp. AG-I]